MEHPCTAARLRCTAEGVARWHITCLVARAVLMPLRLIAILLVIAFVSSPAPRAQAQASAPQATNAAPVNTAEPAPRTAAAQTERMAQAAQLLQDDHALAVWVAGHSQDVAAARSEAEAARAVQRGATLLPNPVVDVAVSNFALGKTNPANFPRDKTLIYGVGLSEMIELGKRGPRGSAAQLRAEAAETRVASTVSERIALARSALGRVLYAQARASELDSSLAQASAAVEVAKGRLDHQALSGVDYDRLLIDLAGIQTEAAHAHADAAGAEAQCAAALLARCDVADATVKELEPAAPVPATWQPTVLNERADIRALKLERSATQQDAKLASARAIPDLTFRLGYTHDSFTYSGDLGNSLALSVSAPLPFFDHGQHAKAEALARGAQLTQLASGTITRARGDVTSLFTRKSSVVAAIATLDNDSIPRANGVLSAEERGLLEGQLDITDLVLARREAIGLRLQALDLHFELFLIRNDLRQALGLDEALAKR
jgi:cobalt-zinc-cadmium efflux system outer membrane protein